VASDRAARWIGAAGGVAGFAIATVALIFSGPQGESIIIVLLCVGLGIAALFVLVGCALAATITARFAADQDHALIRLSRITPEDIFTGYALGARHRLRLLRAIGLWFPAGLLGADMLVGIPAAAFGLNQGLSALFILLYLVTGIVAARAGRRV